VLITGANSGLGFVTARELARAGARVLMVCRNSGRGLHAQAEVAKQATGLAPELLLGDMSSLSSVRTLADEVLRRADRLDVLVNNAGAIFDCRELTPDGIERTFATNHVGPFLLTNLLLDPILATAGSRIVNVAAESFLSRLDFDNLQGEKRYGFLSAYFRSKLENIIFTFDLARRLQGQGVTVNCMSPGPTRTRFGHGIRGPARLIPLLVKPLFPGPDVGARTIIHLASSPEVAAISGCFFLRERIRPAKPVTHDAAVADKLWQICAKLAGLPDGAAPAYSGSA
jgi:NAD(P)-dependent dehydrogenase (short-subunit alcohol dehydrogenase family)